MPKPVRVLARGLRVRVGNEEDIGARVARADGFLLDPADLVHRPVEGELAGRDDPFAVVDVGRAELVDDVEREGEAG